MVIANQAHPIKYHSSGLKMSFVCFTISSCHLLVSSVCLPVFNGTAWDQNYITSFLIQNMSFLLMKLSYFISCYCYIFLIYCLWSKMKFLLKNVVISWMSKVHVKHMLFLDPIFFIKINFNVVLWLLKLSCLSCIRFSNFYILVWLLCSLLLFYVVYSHQYDGNVNSAVNVHVYFTVNTFCCCIWRAIYMYCLFSVKRSWGTNLLVLS